MNFCFFIRYKRPEWSDFAINPFHMVKHCCAQKCTVEIEAYRAYDTVLIQYGRSEREIFSHCFHTYIWKLTLCFPQERFRKLGRRESNPVLEFKSNRLVPTAPDSSDSIYRQMWRRNKGQKRDTPKIGAKLSCEENDNKSSSEREHLGCVFVL